MAQGTRYCLVLFAVMLLLLGGVATFNALVDPYDRYRLVTLRGFNAYKSEASHGLRLYKSLAVRRIAPEAIILGSSRSNIALRTSHPGWGAETPRYNLSVDAATPFEMLALLRHAQAVHPLREVVVGLEFDSFDVHRKPTSDFDPALLRDPDSPWPDLSLFNIDFRLLVSRSAIGASLRTLSQQQGNDLTGLQNRGSEGAGLRYLLFNIPQLLFGPDDMRGNTRGATAEYTENGQENGEHSFNSQAVELFDGSTTGLFIDSEKRLATRLTAIAKDFSLGPRDDPTTPFGSLRSMVAFCREHDIRLYLYIHPGQTYSEAVVSQVGLWPQYEDWKRRLVAMVADDAARHPNDAAYPLWDFSLFSSVTNEPAPTEQAPRSMENFWDAVHYKQAVGDWILDRLFGVNDPNHPVPADFGVRLDPNTIETALAADRAATSNWQAEHATMLGKFVTAARVP